MPAHDAWKAGYEDGLRRVPMASSRAGYPVEYEAAYRKGLLERSRTRRALDRVGRYLTDLAGQR